MKPSADDQFDGFETAKPPPFTKEELKLLATSRKLRDEDLAVPAVAAGVAASARRAT